ncbi:MAG: phenylalanine--tRNA ligase subunit beta [Actinomycetota bacterium]
MRIPLTWLREYAPTDMAVDELAELMTHRGVKVEAVLRPWEGLEGVVVARVLEVRDHPSSDKLCLARLQHAAGEIELVVGVRNMVPGDLVPWASPGARVPTLEEPLGEREIRGVVSYGMLCSPRELAISADHGGILLLNDEGWDVGTDLKRALELDQPVLDIEVEPNRPDFLSIIGVAREVAAATGVPLQSIDHDVAETAEEAAAVASVRIEDPDGCPRYLARVIRGVTHRSSPLWAQARLTACGMRPIDAVVDATNYTMLELGQPLHGFDLATLAGPGIIVRRAGGGERITTLDGVERQLDPADLLICDLEQPVAIAGVMGGRTSEVTGDTSDVLLESAYFTRGGVLLTGRRLDLHSEASHRFERGTDPEGLEAAADRCAQLLAAWAGGTAAHGYARAGTDPIRRWVSVRPARATALLGYPVGSGDAEAVFETLGMAHRAAGDALEVEVPGYRTDIEHEVDLIEEIVRIQGYDRVGTTLPRAPHAGGIPDDAAFAGRVKDALVRAGVREIRPVPFASQDDLDLFGDTDAVPIANPLRAEEGFLRTRLTPGLLHAAAHNLARGVGQVALFEVGTTFRLADPFTEHGKLGFVLTGPAGEGWFAERRSFDVLDATGILAAVLEDLGVGGMSLGAPLGRPFHPGRSAAISIGGRHAGVVGEIHPRVAEALEIDGRVAVCVVGLDPLRDGVAARGELEDVPRFPPVRRDLAFVLPLEVPSGSVEATLREAAGPRLTGCVLFDVFSGSPLPEGSRSLAYGIELREPDRTLTDEEAQSVIDRIVAAVTETYGATLRSG